MKLLLTYRIGDSFRRVTTRTSFPGGRILAASLMVCREIVSCSAWSYDSASPFWEEVWVRQSDGSVIVKDAGLSIL